MNLTVLAVRCINVMTVNLHRQKHKDQKSLYKESYGRGGRKWDEEVYNSSNIK